MHSLSLSLSLYAYICKILPDFPSCVFLNFFVSPFITITTAALEVVNELLAFEKISAGMFTIEPVATSLFPFLKHCMQQHFIPALAKEIKLILGPSVYTEIMVNIDPTKMTIVMRNILSNAIKFSKVGMFVVVSVEVMGFEEGGMVVISVKDSGAGLSKENASRLFQEGLQFNANALQVRTPIQHSNTMTSRAFHAHILLVHCIEFSPDVSIS